MQPPDSHCLCSSKPTLQFFYMCLPCTSALEAKKGDELRAAKAHLDLSIKQVFNNNAISHLNQNGSFSEISAQYSQLMATKSLLNRELSEILGEKKKTVMEIDQKQNQLQEQISLKDKIVLQRAEQMQKQSFLFVKLTEEESRLKNIHPFSQFFHLQIKKDQAFLNRELLTTKNFYLILPIVEYILQCDLGKGVHQRKSLIYLDVEEKVLVIREQTKDGKSYKQKQLAFDELCSQEWVGWIEKELRQFVVFNGVEVKEKKVGERKCYLLGFLYFLEALLKVVDFS